MSDPAELVSGRYRLLRPIGQGGMGKVWQAHDEVLGRDVAIKEILPPPGLSGPEREIFTVRTFREARAAGRVSHAGVAAIYDVLEENGHPWIVMELVRSRTLGALVREEGPLPPMRAVRIGLEVLAALRAAHAAGVLHRDVKPDNVLLAEDGRTVLTDFGIATTEDEASVTRTGQLVGTPAFISPERAMGATAEAPSDLWSLGVTLYVAVEGRSPFQRGHALATLGAVLHAEPAPIGRAGPLGPVIHGLLRKDPAERMTLDEAERCLRLIASGAPPDPTGPLTLPPRRQRRRPPLIALVAAALALALTTGGMALWSGRTGSSSNLPPTVPAQVPAQVPSQAPVADKESPAPSTTRNKPVRQSAQPSRPPARVKQSKQPEPLPEPTRTRSSAPKPSPTPTKTKTKTKTAAPPSDDGSDEDESGEAEGDDDDDEQKVKKVKKVKKPKKGKG